MTDIENQPVKVWITTYALSGGIFEVEGTQSSHYPDLMVYRRACDPGDHYAHGEDKQWHRTKQSAIVRATEMREKKLRSLQKQIAKLERLTFE